MRPTTSVYIATSLDGFISRDDGSLDWLTPFEDPAAFRRFAEFLSTVDAIVMGRNTFAQVVGFGEWPYGDLPVYVLSGSMTALPEGSRATVRLRDSTPDRLLEELGSLGRVYVDGGLTIQRFFARDRIDELTITRVPLILGSGRTLFGPVDSDLRFTHVSTAVWPSGLVQSSYVRVRG